MLHSVNDCNYTIIMLPNLNKTFSGWFNHTVHWFYNKNNFRGDGIDVLAKTTSLKLNHCVAGTGTPGTGTFFSQASETGISAERGRPVTHSGLHRCCCKRRVCTSPERPRWCNIRRPTDRVRYAFPEGGVSVSSSPALLFPKTNE